MDSGRSRQVLDFRIAGNRSTDKLIFEIPESESSFGIAIRVLAAQVRRMPSLKIDCLRRRDTLCKKLVPREFQKSLGCGLAGELLRDEEIVQEWNLHRASVFELARDIRTEHLVDFALKLKLVLG